MNRIKNAKSQLNTFNKVIDQSREYGTFDSEVQNKKRFIITSALKFKTVVAPRTASDWEIYSDMKGADAVANNLHLAMTNLLEAIDSLTVADIKSEEFKTEFRDYL